MLLSLQSMLLSAQSMLLSLLTLHDYMCLSLCVQAAQQHPYVVKPSAGRVGSWVACGALGAIIGCCAINPDGGDYGVWLPQVRVQSTHSSSNTDSKVPTPVRVLEGWRQAATHA
jgi:hypothetical protein